MATLGKGARGATSDPRTAGAPPPGSPLADGAAPGGLPMYDLPELRSATDAFWAAVVREAAARDVALQPRPGRDRAPLDLARDPVLGLSQTCGMPLALGLAGGAQIVATPVYDVPGAAGAAYRSVIIGRRRRGAAGEGCLAALAGARVAVNDAASQSGHHALRRILAATLGGQAPAAVGPVIETGAHRASIEAVAGGRADLAAIDCVSWALVGDVAPVLAARVAVIGVSLPAPGLPFITGPGRGAGDIAALRAALAAAIRDPRLAAERRALRLAGIESVPRAAYDRLAVLARATARTLPDLLPARPG